MSRACCTFDPPQDEVVALGVADPNVGPIVVDVTDGPVVGVDTDGQTWTTVDGSTWIAGSCCTVEWCVIDANGDQWTAYVPVEGGTPGAPVFLDSDGATGTPVAPVTGCETPSSLTDGVNEFTHDNGAGTVVTVPQADVTDNGDGTATITDSEGDTVVLPLCQTVVYCVGDTLAYDVTLATGATLTAGSPVPFGHLIVAEERVDDSSLCEYKAIDQCVQWVDLRFDDICPISYPTCGVSGGASTSLADAAAVQAWLDATYPGLTWDETNCQISGCVDPALDVDIVLTAAIGPCPFAVDAATTLTISWLDFTSGTVDVDWGDGNSDTGLAPGNMNLSHTYAAPFTGDVTFTFSDPCTAVTRFEITGRWSFDIDALNCLDGGKLTLNRFVAGVGNVTTGDIGTLPAGLIVYANAGLNTTSGDIGTLPTGLSFYQNRGLNTTTGDVATLPAGLTYYQNEGSNTTSGDIATLPTGLTFYSNQGLNTTTGDIATLPTGLTFYSNQGLNTTSGDIGTLPTGLTFYANTGSNTTSGDIGTLPTGLTLYLNEGSNTTSGDIGTLPAGVTYYQNIGLNTTSGDIGTLPAGVTFYQNQGLNTTSGDIGTLPAGLTVYSNQGLNTTTGDIGTLPAGLTYYGNAGLNTTSGDIGTLPTGLTYYANTGSNTATYTTSYGFTALTREFTQRGSAGLSAAEVDQILIDMAAVGLTPVNEQLIDLSGLNAAPTAASAAAITTLTGLGWTVITN